MKIVFAPDSFKGSLSAREAADAASRGVLRAFPTAEIAKIPVSDGGEGFMSAVYSQTGGELISLSVSDPLGRKTTAEYLICGDTAVIELASAAGLCLLSKNEYNPLAATTYGVGEMIADALFRGAKRVVVGIGGSATCDCGVGMLRALGVRFFDKARREIAEYGGGALEKIALADRAGMCDISGVEFVAACDVTNPLCGERGAAYVFAPQKGADAATVARLDAGLRGFASAARIDAEREGAGAAGGVGAALFDFLGARAESGIELFLSLCNFDKICENADYIITGEGKTDSQSAHGKAVAGIARAGKRLGVPVIVLSGCVEECDIDGVCEAHQTRGADMPLEYAMAHAAELLEEKAYEIMKGKINADE